MVYGTYNYSYWLINQLITGGPHIAVDVLIFPSDFPQLGGQSATEKDTKSWMIISGG